MIKLHVIAAAALVYRAGAITAGQMIKHSEAVMDAVLDGNLQEVERLMDDMNSNPQYYWFQRLTLNPQFYPLHVAAVSDDVPMVALLLRKGADVSTRDGENFTALHRAARVGARQIVEQLIDAGAKIDEVGGTGWDALQIAAYHGKNQVVRVLLKSGFSVSNHAVQGRAGAHHLAALGNGTAYTVELLLDAGAGVNDRSPSPIELKGSGVVGGGNTPLHSAAVANKYTVIKLLLSRGADPTLCINRDGVSYTPASLAREKGYKEAAELLEDAERRYLEEVHRSRTQTVIACAVFGAVILALLFLSYHYFSLFLSSLEEPDDEPQRGRVRQGAHKGKHRPKSRAVAAVADEETLKVSWRECAAFVFASVTLSAIAELTLKEGQHDSVLAPLLGVLLCGALLLLLELVLSNNSLARIPDNAAAAGSTSEPEPSTVAAEPVAEEQRVDPLAAATAEVAAAATKRAKKKKKKPKGVAPLAAEESPREDAKAASPADEVPAPAPAPPPTAAEPAEESKRDESDDDEPIAPPPRGFETVARVLAHLGEAHLLPTFQAQLIDDDALPFLEPSDLIDLGVAPMMCLAILGASAARGKEKKLEAADILDDVATHQSVLEAELREHRAELERLRISTAELPEDMCCAITCELMKEPYLCVGDSHTYERVAIEQWFATGARTSPTTNERLDNLTLVPNHAMRRLIAALLERRRET